MIFFNVYGFSNLLHEVTVALRLKIDLDYFFWWGEGFCLVFGPKEVRHGQNEVFQVL